MTTKLVLVYSLVSIVCVALQIGIADGHRFKRQGEFQPETPDQDTALVGTTENFDDFLNDVFKDLGIGLDESDSATSAAEDQANESFQNETSGSFNTTGDPVNTTAGPLAQDTDETTTNSSEKPEVAEGSTEPLPSPSIPPLSEDGSTQTSGSDTDTQTNTNAGESGVYTTPAPTPNTVPRVSTTTEASAVNPNCQVRAVLSDFCIIPDELLQFIGPSADIHDISDYVISMQLVDMLTETCPPGSWCLDSEHAYRHLEEKIAFWSNSSDFVRLCWQPLYKCLRSVAEFFAGCEIYGMYELIAETNKLLCAMKEEPMASRDCMEQTLKALHVTMADLHRQSLVHETSENTDVCKARNASMTTNYLCAKSVCGDYTDLLNEFKSWEFFMPSVEALSERCPFDSAKCSPPAEKEADEIEEQKEAALANEESENSADGDTMTGDLSDTSSEENVDNQDEGTMKALAGMDVPTVLVVSAVCVAALAFFMLVGVVMCLRRRKTKYRTREGVEYMEILPDMDD